MLSCLENYLMLTDDHLMIEARKRLESWLLEY